MSLLKEFGIIFKEVVMAYFKICSQNEAAYPNPFRT
jgi:hypothetical protein